MVRLTPRRISCFDSAITALRFLTSRSTFGMPLASAAGGESTVSVALRAGRARRIKNRFEVRGDSVNGEDFEEVVVKGSDGVEEEAKGRGEESWGAMERGKSLGALGFRDERRDYYDTWTFSTCIARVRKLPQSWCKIKGKLDSVESGTERRRG